MPMGLIYDVAIIRLHRGNLDMISIKGRNSGAPRRSKHPKTATSLSRQDPAGTASLPSRVNQSSARVSAANREPRLHDAPDPVGRTAGRDFQFSEDLARIPNRCRG